MDDEWEVDLAAFRREIEEAIAQMKKAIATLESAILMLLDPEWKNDDD